MLKLNVLTPERKAVVDLDVMQVTVPAYSGEMTILPGHAPLVTTLGTGIIKYKVGADKMYKALISSGYCEVTPLGVNVLAEFMQLPEEVNVDAEQVHLQTAEKKLVTEVLDDVDYEETRTEVAKAQGAINLVKLH